MALTDFAVKFDNSYQEVFRRKLVAKEIMNSRFEPTLKYGESVERVAFDTSGVLVRDAVRTNTASTIDDVTDSPELLTINLEKEAAFYLPDGAITQAGPLNPAQNIGKDVAKKVADDLDGRCFAEIHNASLTFDTGDLTTMASTGVPIELTSTTVPQMVTRMPAKLRRTNHIDVDTNMVLIVDSYAAGDIEQYLLGKSIDIAGAVFKNGYAGLVRNAALYVSENLPGEVTLTVTDIATADNTMTINGVVWTFKAVPAAAGEVDIAAATEEDQAVLIGKAINNTNAYAAGAGANTAYFEVSAADRAILSAAGISATVSGAIVTIRSRSGRITVAETFTATSAFSNNSLCAYYGKKGAIDLVIQDMKEVDIRKCDDRRGVNVFTSYLAGVKTFADGAKKFMKVLIKA
jgi:hypothetical protein